MPRTATVLPLVLLVSALALAGCTGTDADGETGAEHPGTASSEAPEAEGEGGGSSPTACVVGRWAADVDDLAAQLGSVLADTGMTVITTRAAGTQTVNFTEIGDFRFDNDVVIAVDVQISDGPTMTAAQSHRGTTTATWGWDATSSQPAMIFEGYDDSAYSVENSVSIGGVTSTTPIEIPPIVDASGRLFVTCSGDELVTTWEDGLFITTWHRA
jgi:hypothetical protein